MVASAYAWLDSWEYVGGPHGQDWVHLLSVVI